jgi:hypothetical protein
MTRWRALLRSLFTVPDDAATRVARDIGRIGIGFCPSCKRLRSTTSLKCDYCTGTRPVVPDA